MIDKFQAFLLISVLSFQFGYSQNNQNVHFQINWSKSSIIENHETQKVLDLWECDECQIYHEYPQTPLIVRRIKIDQNATASIRIENATTQVVELNDARSIDQLKEDYQIHHWISQEKSDYFLTIKIFPFKKAGATTYVLNDFDLSINLRNKPVQFNRDPTTTLSKLNDGDIYKIAIPEGGVYEMDSEFLSDLGIDVGTIDPRKIQILGNEGGKLAQSLAEECRDDLAELAIEVTGQEDGSFDTGDKIRFYADGADRVIIEGDNFIYDKNIYDLNNYVFLKIGSANGKRVAIKNEISNADYSFSDYDYFLHFEDDKVNLLGDYNLTQGSGQDWYGDRFKTTRSRDYSSFFNIPGLLPGEVQLKASFAARSANTSNGNLRFDSENLTLNFASSNVEDVESEYAKRDEINTTFNLSNSSPTVSFSYPETGTTSEAWIDYISLSCNRRLEMLNQQMYFTDLDSRNSATADFTLTNAANTTVWDISEYSEVKSINGNGPTINHGFNTGGIARTFVAFKSYLTPIPVGKINNQNIHGINDIELVVIYHKDFESATQLFLDHRSEINPLNGIMVDIDWVYNEFSSGRVDPTAIRNFAKMIYDRTQNFNYLLLMGDGTYDFKNLMPDVPNGNFVPTYQTKETTKPITAFPSDDYFALLSDQEGANLRGELDIAVGRIPAKTLDEANTIVNKIIRYETDPATLGEWRIQQIFCADDEDGNTHLKQSNGIAMGVEQNHPLYNQTKIYWGAYVQESTPGGDRYPAATEALNKAVQSGALLTNYLGHGGSNGWSQERVLKVTDIQNFQNTDRLTTFVTATCSFTGFDDPGRITAGELCLSNPNGGAVSLLTTTRAVFINQNKRLTEAVYDTIFTKENGDYLRLGEVMRRAKNSNAADTFGTNARKFAIIGDPTLKLAIPKYDVFTTSINSIDVNNGIIDTIGALEKLTITGFVANSNGEVKTDFNGTVYPVIYDKSSTIQTLGNDATQKINFDVRKNVIFKGSASVINGQFTFSCIVPRDIDYAYGKGKISYYATDGISEDAAGFFTDLVIGGSGENAIIDDQGPTIELFMNNVGFEYGGITGKSPTLLAHLSDDNGINITGNSIGHDLLGTLDDNQSQSFILNEFYTAEIDDYTRGTVEFPLENLELGPHKILVKAWDVANNSSEALIEFIVVDSEGTALKNVLNYPNPFTTSTDFSFNTDLRNTPLDVLINIYTLSGKLVKTIQESAVASGGYVDGLNWNGKDDFGSSLAKGVYLYKIKVRSNQLDSRQESQFEKLVILK